MGHRLNFIKARVLFQQYERMWNEFNEDHFELGLMIGGSFEVLSHTSLFLRADVQYNFVGGTTLGSYSFFGDGETTRIDRFKIDNNHWVLALGFGVRYNVSRNYHIFFVYST